MALRIELKPHERIIIGKVALTNGPTRTTFVVDGRAPILRCKDVITPEEADTVCKKLYVLIERVYLEEISFEEAAPHFHALAAEIVGAAPSTKRFLAAIAERFVAENLYAALKLCRKLIAYERSVIAHAQQAA
ncbi:flagellar biosynthesis repressor FlbT [Salinarimonas sp.]|uniref:flagellar biosynthesis repressor FlbT n=1 Tax=Salinarimonas sp. TaxID=2766526 RepID=UPI0032D8D411